MSIVITGSGIISPVGIGWEAFQTGLWSETRGFDWAEGSGGSASRAEVTDFQVQCFLESEKTYLDRASAFTLAACSLARREAGWETSDVPPGRTGIVLGTAYGCLETMQAYYERLLARGAKFASSLLFSHSYANTPASLAAIEFRLGGYHSTVCAGLTSGAAALAQAADALRDGRAEALLAGGVEALAEPLERGLAGYCWPGRDQARRCGLILGEGAAVFLLETAAQAQRRGARKLACLTGVGLSHTSSLGCGEGLARAIQAALREAGRGPSEVDVVFANGNGWPPLDDEEATAVRAIFPATVPVVLIKARWGETLGAGAALSLAAALAAFAAGKIPAPHTGRREGPTDLRVALLNSIDFGGSCVSLVVEKAE